MRAKPKLVNADWGVDSVEADPARRTWYRWHRFPLLPRFDARDADEFNPASASFGWLNFRAWTGMSPQLGFGFEIEDIGILLRINLPYLYLRWWLAYFPSSWHQRWWRKGTGER